MLEDGIMLTGAKAVVAKGKASAGISGGVAVRGGVAGAREV